jgi:hypothetical protein
MDRLLRKLMRGVNRQVFERLGDRILSGPFKGMLIPEVSFWEDGNASAKLFGCYEAELHEALECAIRRKPEVVVNVGCSDGYYAIGLARVLPGVKIVAFDVIPESREECQVYAQLNGVEVDVRDGCLHPFELRLPDVSGDRLYIMDCEGHELDLINLDECPELVQSDIIVECHDFLVSDSGKKIADLLCRTHTVELVRPKPINLEQFGFMRQSPTVIAALAVIEKRPMPSLWLVCWAPARDGLS